MTVSVELLLNVASAIAITFLVITWIWTAKSNNSLCCRVARLLTNTVLTAIEVGLLTVHCLNGESYGLNLFLVFIWLLNVVITAFDMRD